MAENRELQIVLTAKDKASKELKESGDTIGKAFGAAKTTIIATVAAVTSAAAAVTAFGISSFKSYLEAEKQMVIANQALKNAIGDNNGELIKAKQAMGEVSKAATKLGMDDESAAVAFSKLLGVTKDVTQAQNEVKLALDLSAYSGRSVEEATQALLMVHAGGTRVLKEFGVEVKEGTSALDALSIVQSKVGGTAQTMADSTGGALARLSESWTNLKKIVGQALAEAINPFISTLANWFQSDRTQEKIEGIIAAFKDFDTVKSFVKEELNKFFDAIDSKLGIITILKQAWDDVSTVFRENLLPKLKELWEILTPLKPFLEVFAKIIGVILYGAIIALIKIIEGGLIVVMTILGTTIDAVKIGLEAIAKVWDTWTTILSKIINFVDTLISKIKQLDIVSKAVGAVSNFLGFGGGKAMGGSVSSGKSYLVGEQGPELFTPGQGGTITPNGRISGSGINISIVVNGDVSGQELVDKVINSISKQLTFNTRNAI
ncbi:MAG: hypothetical protein NTZ18_03625 [Candidatus Komeilibacteria bacterium]|nr:hypothetical protein [Candidatus Komeilibacteria bacterium]